MAALLTGLSGTGPETAARPFPVLRGLKPIRRPRCFLGSANSFQQFLYRLACGGPIQPGLVLIEGSSRKFPVTRRIQCLYNIFAVFLGTSVQGERGSVDIISDHARYPADVGGKAGQAEGIGLAKRNRRAFGNGWHDEKMGFLEQFLDSAPAFFC